MTHAELLAKITPKNRWVLSYEELEKHNKAIRAVVELHTNTEDGYCAWCYLCNYDRTGLSMDSAMYAYPCPTIQAIQEQLK